MQLVASQTKASVFLRTRIMAEERLHLPVGSESSKPVVPYLRRNSTGSYVPAGGEEKILPHYMRASVGSCHDHCKFGKKHSTEEKVRRVFSKRIVAKPSNERNASVSLRKVTPAVKPEKASASRIHSHGTSDIMNGEMTRKSHLIQITRRDKVVMEKKVSIPGPRSLLNIKSYPSCTSRPLKRAQSEKIELSSRNASPKAKEVSLSGEHTALSKLKTVAEKKCSSTAPSEALRAKKPLRASESSAEKRAVNSKVLSRKTSSSSSSSSSRATLSLKQSFSRAASLTARKLKSLKAVSSLKNQNNRSTDEEQLDIKETNKDKPEEKTLHVIKVEDEDQHFESEKIEDSALECSPRLKSMGKTCAINMEDKVLESNWRGTCSMESVTHLSVSKESPSLQTCESLPFIGDVDGEDDEIIESGAAEDRSVSEDDEAVSVGESCPLKGRNRGKVVRGQSENNGVRILKFRRARTLEPNLNGKVEVFRRFRKREVGDDMINDEGCSMEKVVLKHLQDMQGKKDTQGLLFNNVIEQTASKLVESRKSKVKALVGAFETVISLQESKSFDHNKLAIEGISDSEVLIEPPRCF